MKFILKFSDTNLSKFRAFIKLCAKTFTKSGIIMTIINNSKIMVAPDPFSISDQFERDYFETKVMDLYKSYTFIDYPLISSQRSKKNSTYESLDLKVRQNNNINDNESDSSNKEKVTFRIAIEELKKLNDLLQTNFLASNELTLKATHKPDFMNKGTSQNYSKAFLSIFDKPTNSIKSGILFKALKHYFDIIDFEDDCKFKIKNNQENNLGIYLYNSIFNSKFVKKFCGIVNKNFNKKMNFYVFKERDLTRKADKSYLVISYLNNSFMTGKILNNHNDYNINIDDTSQMEEFNKIYKITILSGILIKILKNFNSDINNPDYISIWSKGLVMKTNFFTQNINDADNNNNKENFFPNENIDDEGLPFQQEEYENEDNLCYMIIKSLIYYDYKIEIINYDKDMDEKKLSIKQYVKKLIENSIDDAHEELNKSKDLTFDDKEEELIEPNISDDENEVENEIMNELSDVEGKKEEKTHTKRKIRSNIKISKHKKTKKNKSVNKNKGFK